MLYFYLTPKLILYYFIYQLISSAFIPQYSAKSRSRLLENLFPLKLVLISYKCDTIKTVLKYIFSNLQHPYSQIRDFDFFRFLGYYEGRLYIMERFTKTVAAIHDLSGFGRCSLSVISPVLSVMGLQTVAIPTAVLSTHTGGFGDVSFNDLTDFLPKTLEHYRRLGLSFDCVYTGFLGSQAQIGHCLNFINASPNAIVVVDPVMGDNGKTYKTYSREMCTALVELVGAADLITPNKTEMFILLGQEFSSAPLTHQAAKSCLVRLSELGPSQVVVTGVELADMTVCNIGYDKDTGSFWRVVCSYVPQNYPGTGDIFAAILVGGILNGDSLAIAMERATRFLELTIKTTYSYGSDPKEGVMLEKNLGWLTQSHLLAGYEIL